MRIRSATLLALALFCVLASPAAALTICLSPCTSTGGPVAPEPVEVADLGAITTGGIVGIVLGPESPEIPIVAAGSVIVHVPSGVLVAASIDWRAGGQIDLSEPITIDVGSGDIELCTAACAPFEDGTPAFPADPFHVTVLAPLSTPFELQAGGDIVVTSSPVPEPTTGLLVGLGVAALARHARRLRYT